MKTATMSLHQFRMINREAGFHFFAQGTLSFFRSRILGDMLPGDLFITSERGCDPGAARRYTVRHARQDGRVDTVGEFMAYATAREARAAARREASA